MQAIHIIGDGCAGLSLAARARDLPDHQLTLIVPEGAPPPQEHIWGFWRLTGLDAAVSLAHQAWETWRIVTEETSAELASSSHPYHALYRSRWEAHCRTRAEEAGVRIVNQQETTIDPSAQILDSRPSPIPHGQLMQHFIGWEVTVESGTFDPSMATLMDFRCDQSRGIHFIYVLPFSDSEALVESTMFCSQRAPDDFFETAISTYLKEHHGQHNYSVTRVENGAIPMGRLRRSSDPAMGLGGNGGAIKPSSGYAFSFIQKQIAAAIASTSNRTNGMKVRPPHKMIDLWMDEVFVTVMRQWPTAAPNIFMRMARGLTGDEFAIFLSGEATWHLRLKVILAMPKWIFIRSFMRLLFGRDTTRLKTGT
ncbi:MAG: lycopene cyclase family protein [Rhodospirillales bacterium]|nr:lycopene cyclase family protein [Rhodospirillales bacterium]